jgi:hypothetical protein
MYGTNLERRSNLLFGITLLPKFSADQRSILILLKANFELFVKIHHNLFFCVLLIKPFIP